MADGLVAQRKSFAQIEHDFDTLKTKHEQAVRAWLAQRLLEQRRGNQACESSDLQKQVA